MGRSVTFRLGFTASIILAAMLPATVMAAETITYTYDAKGRLVKVERSGSVNDGVETDYEHDQADNRERVKTTGVPPA